MTGEDVKTIVVAAVAVAGLSACATGGSIDRGSRDRVSAQAELIQELYGAGCDIASFEQSARFKSTKVTCK